MTTTTDDAPIKVSPSVYRRLTSGLPGFIVAMAACFVVVGMVLLVTPRGNDNAVPHVDYKSDLTGLLAVAPYPVYAPVGLPPKWYPNSSRLSGQKTISWHLGFYTPKKEYAALEESNEAGASFVPRMIVNQRQQGTVQIGDAAWEKYYRADKKQSSLVRRLPGSTLVITGTAPYDEIAALAGSLRLQPKNHG